MVNFFGGLVSWPSAREKCGGGVHRRVERKKKQKKVMSSELEMGLHTKVATLNARDCAVRSSLFCSRKEVTLKIRTLSSSFYQTVHARTSCVRTNPGLTRNKPWTSTVSSSRMQTSIPLALCHLRLLLLTLHLVPLLQLLPPWMKSKTRLISSFSSSWIAPPLNNPTLQTTINLYSKMN